MEQWRITKIKIKNFKKKKNVWEISGLHQYHVKSGAKLKILIEFFFSVVEAAVIFKWTIDKSRLSANMEGIQLRVLEREKKWKYYLTFTYMR